MTEPAERDGLERLLAPIPGTNPGGTDLRYHPSMDRLRSLRSAASATPGDRTGWPDVAKLAADLLEKQSKDLQIAIWLLESWTRLDGFEGARRGLDLLGRLVDLSWEALFPAIVDDDSEPLGDRIGVMGWVTDRLPQILKYTPLTDATGAYALVHWEVTQKVGAAKQSLIEDDGWPSFATFDKVMQRSSLSFLEAVRAQVAACSASLDDLERASASRFVERGRSVLSLGPVREVFDSCALVLDRYLERKKGKQKPSLAGDGATEKSPGLNGGLGVQAAESAADDVWTQARALVRAGQTEGLRLAQAEVAAATCGREAFLRQLELAEICVEAGMHALAYPLLDELGRIVDERRLDEWEDKSTLQRVWAGLRDSGKAMGPLKPACAARAEEAEARLQGHAKPEAGTEGEDDTDSDAS